MPCFDEQKTNLSDQTGYKGLLVTVLFYLHYLYLGPQKRINSTYK